MKTKEKITNIFEAITVIGVMIGLDALFYKGSIFSVDFIIWLLPDFLTLISCIPFILMILGGIWLDEKWINYTLNKGINVYCPRSHENIPKSFTDSIYILRRVWLILTILVICSFLLMYIVENGESGNVNNSTNDLMILICILLYVWSATKFRTGNWALAGAYLLFSIRIVYKLCDLLNEPADFRHWVGFIFVICILSLSCVAFIKCIKYALKREKDIRFFSIS